jgi:ribosomal protein L11 methyltransferase
MSASPVWKVAVQTTPEAEDAVAELMSRHLGAPASAYTPLGKPATVVSVYLSSKPPTLASSCRALRADLNRLHAWGLSPGRCRIIITRVSKWAESWKRHFKPIEAGPLLVRPGWSRRRPRQDQLEVVLDPGLAFGTGQHPTTSFCLHQIAALRREDRPQSLLDLGTGSGILAIAAVRLGYTPVRAVDFDPAALRVARANARRNRVQLQIVAGDVHRLSLRPRVRYHVICANLLADLLIARRARIIAQLQAGGVLVLAGILKSEFHKVQRAYETAGLRLTARRTQKEWCSASFASARVDAT